MKRRSLGALNAPTFALGGTRIQTVLPHLLEPVRAWANKPETSDALMGELDADIFPDFA